MDCLVCEMFGVWDVFGVGCLMSGLFFLSCCVVWGLWWFVLWCVLCGSPVTSRPFHMQLHH
jgi:hypothetical protein